MEATATADQAYRRQLDDRLTRLPAEIAAGISPPAIAEAITESLRQAFVRSGLPATAEALALLSTRLHDTTRDFQRAAGELGAAYRGAAVQATHGIEQLYRSVTVATETARSSMLEFKRAFRLDYWWSVGTLIPTALLVGILLGFLLHHWRMDRAEPVSPMPPATRQPSRPSASRPGSVPLPPSTRWSRASVVASAGHGTLMEQVVEQRWITPWYATR